MVDYDLHKMAKHLSDQGEPITEEYLPPFINGDSKKAVDIIMHMNTQWNYISGVDVIKIGLNYSSLNIISGIIGIRITKKLFVLIQRAEDIILRRERKND